MASVKAFVSVLSDFVSDLQKVFPDDKYLKKYEKRIQDDDPQEILDSFVADMSEYSKSVTNKDIELFKGDCHIVKRLHLNKLHKKMDSKTLEMTWNHLSTLNILSTTIKSVPSGLLKNIESLAEQFATELDDKNESLEDLDMTKLMSSMQGMLKM